MSDAARVLAAGILLLPATVFADRAPPLLQRLLSDELQVREDADKEFSKLREQSKTALIPRLIEVLKSTDTSSAHAAEALKSAGPIARGAVPELLRILNGDHSDCAKSEAAEALAAIAPDEPDTLRALITLLNAPDDGRSYFCEARTGAILALFKMANANKATIPTATEALKGPGREEASNFLVWMGTAAVPYLAAALHWDDPKAREYALYALIGLKGGAESAFKELVFALDDEVFLVRRHASIALEGIKHPEAPRILKAYRERERIRLRERFAQVRHSDLRNLVMGTRRNIHHKGAYQLRIHGDGRVLYGWVNDEGEEVMKVPREQVMELLDAFERSDFFFMRATPIEGFACIGGFSITYLSLDDKTALEVLDDCGLVPNEALMELSNKVDSIGQAKRWGPLYR